MDYKTMYDNLFNLNHYSIHNETELRYNITKDFILNNKIENIIDVGSGRGVMLNMILNDIKNIKITSVDLNNYHNNNDVEFINIDLSNRDTFFYGKKYDLLSCLDVLEHLEKKYIEDIFIWFSKISENQIFSIANHSEIINGQEIHLIQENHFFWEDLISKYFTIDDLIIKSFSNNHLYIFKTKTK